MLGSFHVGLVGLAYENSELAFLVLSLYAKLINYWRDFSNENKNSLIYLSKKVNLDFIPLRWRETNPDHFKHN